MKAETLWGGRFTKPTDETVMAFNASIGFDKRLVYVDIEGSIAHAGMLGRQGIISESDAESIIAGLCGIRDDLQAGRLAVDESYEDVHSFVEAVLVDRIGEAGKRLHTGRSRNDQVALDMKLYTRSRIDELDALVKNLLLELLRLMHEHQGTYMPGFTHLQKAQPVTLAHELGAYFEMFRRDRDRLADTRRRMNYCPLGSGALAGTTYPLDREWVAGKLGFIGPARNSMDAVSDRDYLIELMSDLSMVMTHLSRFCEELILWNSQEYGFVEMDDAYSTGSSIMPQKKNPDVAELIRGKTGRVYGDLMSLLVTMKGIPLAYDKDMQEDKEPAFDAMDTVCSCIELFTGMLTTARFRPDVMRASALGGFANATDAADYLVGRGVPFRDAHRVVGEMVLGAIDRGCSLEELPLDVLQGYSPAIDSDFYESIGLEACVSRRETKGAPGPRAMKEYLAVCEEYLRN